MSGATLLTSWEITIQNQQQKYKIISLSLFKVNNSNIRNTFGFFIAKSECMTRIFVWGFFQY